MITPKNPELNVLLQSSDYLNSNMKKYVQSSKLIYQKKHSLFYLKGYSKNKNKKFINSLDITCKRLHQLSYDLKKKFNVNTKYLNIIIVDCPQKRKFIDNKFFINGGFTYLNGDTIYIYRFEEFQKVVLHEFLHHHFIYDHNEYLYINNIKINFNEAIIEFLATYYQCKFTNTLINDEIKYSKEIAQKVIAINLNNNTNIFSYCVIKYILLQNYKNILINIKNPKYIINYIMNFKLKLKPIKPKYNEELKFVSCSNI